MSKPLSNARSGSRKGSLRALSLALGCFGLVASSGAASAAGSTAETAMSSAPFDCRAASDRTTPDRAVDLSRLNQARTSSRTARALGEVEAAESHARRALAEGWRLLAAERCADGELDGAEAAYAAAVATAPTDAQAARVALASLRGARGDVDFALRELRDLVRSQEVEPTTHGNEARRALVFWLARAGKGDEAAIERDALARRSPDEAARAFEAGERQRAAPPATPQSASPVPPSGWSTHRHRLEEGVVDLQLTLDGLIDRSAADLVLETLSQVTGFGDGLEPGSLRARLVESRLLEGSFVQQPGEPVGPVAREVIEQLRRDAETGPLDRDLALVLAEIERRDGRLAAANHQLRSLVDRFASTTAHAQLARNALAFEQPKLAIEHARRALDGAPSSEAALRLVAESAFAAGLEATAAPAVEALARMRPGEPVYAEWVGRVWMALGDMGEAAEALGRAVRLYEQANEETTRDEVTRDEASRDALQTASRPAREALGLALLHEQRFDEARSALETAAALLAEGEVSDPRIDAARAEIEERSGDAEAARRRAERVLERAPSSARALAVLGRLDARAGRFAEARDRFEQAIATGDAPASVRYQLSLACRRLADDACATEQLAAYHEALDASASTLQTTEPVTLMQRVEPDGETP